MNFNGKRILVLYYSYEGNTEFVAKSIQEQIGADMVRLEVLDQKDRKGLSKYLWGGSQVVMGSTPKLKEINVNPNDYDLIFLGSPVWASSYAPAFNTFFNENGSIESKDIILFCCHAGGGGNKAFSKVKKRLKNNDFLAEIAFVNPRKNLDKKEMDNQVGAWLETIE